MPLSYLGSVSDCSSARSCVFLTKDQQQQLASYKEQGTAASINTLLSTKGFPFHFLSQLCTRQRSLCINQPCSGPAPSARSACGIAAAASPCSDGFSLLHTSAFFIKLTTKGMFHVIPGHAVNGLQTLQRVTLPEQDLVGPGCRWEPQVILSSD